jgi:hypothetical protein
MRSVRNVRQRGLPLLVLWLAALLPGLGRATWTADVSTGSAVNLYSPLVIRQKDFPDIRMNGEFRTRPFEEVPYYDVRVGTRLARAAWELELVHHKLYLENRSSEVERFEITHGFNLITVNRVWTCFGFDLRTGAGIVLAHPQSIVRDAAFPEDAGALGLGWYISGAAMQAGFGRRFRLSRRFDAGLEGKLTAAAARVPIAQGSADIANLAAHGLVGLRYRF